jgi:hypothetical protein
MPDDLQERVVSLERSRRRWRLAAIASWVGFALLIVFPVVLGYQARLAAEHARADAARAEAEQERARNILEFLNAPAQQKEKP